MELARGEQLIISTRPHARVLTAPVLTLLVVSAVVGAGIAAMPEVHRAWGWPALGIAGCLAVIWWVLRPVLRWASVSTTLTTQRLIARSGILRRTTHEVPLNRIVEVSRSRRAADVGFGSGTLLLTTVSGALLRLDNVPRVKAMQQAVGELVSEVSPEPTVIEPWP